MPKDIHEEVVGRLGLLLSDPRDQVQRALSAQDHRELTEKLESLAATCGIPAGKVADAIGSFRRYLEESFGDGVDDAATDDIAENFFSAYGERLRNPPTKVSGPDAEKALADMGRRIAAGPGETTQT